MHNCSPCKIVQLSGKLCQFKALFCNMKIKRRSMHLIGQNGILMKQVYEYELKNYSIYCGMFFCWQIPLDGLIEEYSDLFPTTNQ